MKRHATGQGSPVQVRSFGRTSLPLRRLPPDVQRCDQDRPQREAEEQIRSHRDGLSPTEGVRSSHPLHPVCMRGSLLGLSEQGQKVRPVHRESVPQAGQPELLAESLAPENPHHPETLRLPDSPRAPTIISPSSMTLPSRGAPSRSPAARSASPSRRRLRRRRLWEEVGIDVNERNVTASDTSGITVVFDTSNVAELKERYRAIRAKIGRRTRRDNRISRRLYARYGTREKNRTTQALHRVSKAIVSQAKEKKFGTVMEKLKGIRKLYRRGNGQGPSFRGRMNSWTFRELQRQVEYKARWEGIPVSYVNPRGTSSKCPNCDSPLIELEGRRLVCPSCRQSGDRDVIASRNIMAALVRAARPSKGSGERVSRRQEEASNPRSRWMEVSVGDGPKG